MTWSKTQTLKTNCRVFFSNSIVTCQNKGNLIFLFFLKFRTFFLFFIYLILYFFSFNSISGQEGHTGCARHWRRHWLHAELQAPEFGGSLCNDERTESKIHCVHEGTEDIGCEKVAGREVNFC